MSGIRILYILAAGAAFIAFIIDLLDGNPLKTAGTGFLFLAFLIQALFYPNLKGWKTVAVFACLAIAIGILAYRIFIAGL